MNMLRKRTRRINAKNQQKLALMKGELEGCERSFMFYSMYLCTVLLFFMNVCKYFHKFVSK